MFYASQEPAKKHNKTRTTWLSDTVRRSQPPSQSVTLAGAETTFTLQKLVKAVSGAVVGLRGQLEALTILDETALTWPGLSLVLEDLEVLVNLLTTRACEAELKVEQLQHSVTALQAAYERSRQEYAAASKAKQDLESDAATHNKELHKAKSELASSRAELQRQTEQSTALQTSNAELKSAAKYKQQEITSLQGQLAEAQKLSTSQAEQIATLREELHGSLAECDQLEARLQDKEQAVAGLQQQVQAGHRQQAAVHEQLLASNGREGRLQGEVSTLSRQLTELQEEHSAQGSEIRKLYDWRDVMKTVHNERLQELAAKHQTDRDQQFATISQREGCIEGQRAALTAANQQLATQAKQAEAQQATCQAQASELQTAKASVTQLQSQVQTAQASHTRQLSEAAQLRQELRQLSTRLELAESDQQHLEATCKQTAAIAEAEWAKRVAESEKEAAIQMVLAEGWQREVALLQPQLGLVQKQLADTQRQEVSRQEADQQHAAQHHLSTLQAQLAQKDEHIKQVTAQAASQQASANYVIQQLQTRLDNTQADIVPALEAAQIHDAQHPWSIQEATARVAQVLQAMTTS